MPEIKTRFDGKTIQVPAEMDGLAAGEVTILHDLPMKSGHSFWDFVGKHPNPKTAEEIDAILKEERDSWDDK